MRTKSDWGKAFRRFKTGAVKPFKASRKSRKKSGVLLIKRFAVRTKVDIGNLRRKKSIYGG